MTNTENHQTLYDDGSQGAARLLESGAQLSPGVRAWLGPDLHIGEGVVIGADSHLVADTLTLGDGVRIGAGSDVRASNITIGARTELLPRVTVLVADTFVLGAASRIEAEVSITCRSFTAGKLFYFGHHSSVGYGGTTASTAHMRIGDRVALGPHNILNANLPIDLGDQVGSGCYLSIWTHGYHFGHRLTDGFDATFKGVRIEPNVWLGFHVSVLPGVTIGADTIVAGGAVVSRDLPNSVLAGGVPAKPIKALQQRTLPDDEMWSNLETLLDEWCAELTWKRIQHQRLSAHEITIGATHVVGLTPNEPVPASSSDELVLLTLEPRADAQAPNQVIFELRSGMLHGNPSMIGHDLRDHLRRNALPCGDGEPFKSLPSEPFARLTATIPLQDQTHRTAP